MSERFDLAAASGEPGFAAWLDRYFGGEPDGRTLALI
jgi:uncharacterized protein (DUF1810 family)